MGERSVFLKVLPACPLTLPDLPVPVDFGTVFMLHF